MKKFLWAAAHDMTPEQRESLTSEGEVILLKEVNPEFYQELLNSPDNAMDLKNLASNLLSIADANDAILVQPAGSPAFQLALGIANFIPDMHIRYAHTKRVSKDVPQEDGTIIKTSTFKHEGWIKF